MSCSHGPQLIENPIAGVEIRKAVASENGRLIGLVSFGSSDNDLLEGRAEIKHLYLNGMWRGRGLGRHLVQMAFQDLALSGHTGIGLAVVEDNASARAFYKSMGGQETVVFTDPGPIWKSTNILVTWPLPACPGMI